MQKRFQYIGKGGKITWTKWFQWDSDIRDEWQMKSYGLKNEYKES